MGFNEWSDDENPHTRDRFRHERSLERERFGEDYERHDRKRRGRSPPEDDRHKRRPSPPPMRGYHPRSRNYRDDPEVEHYIPNYDRDGYKPGPRYKHRNERNAPQFAIGGYSMMDMMSAPMMAPGWGNQPRFPVIDPAQLDYMVSFRHFVEFTKRNANRRIDDEDMQRRFSQYKEEFSARQLAQFFNSNKERQWFQEKYHPTVSLPRKNDVKERRRRYLKEFLDALERGEYDKVRYDKNEKSTTEEDDDTEQDVADDDTNGEYDERLVIKTVPPTIAREEIIQMCQKVEGFDYIALSDPNPSKKFHRVGWIKFKPGTDMKSAFEQLDNQKVDEFVFHLAMNRKNASQSHKRRIAPEITNTTDRLHKDLEQAKEVAIAFEAELGEDAQEGLKAVEARALYLINHSINDNVDSEETDPERVNLKKNLDLIITYLKHVHMYCYYCALECDSVEELMRKCPDDHCRTTSKTELPNDAKLAAKAERQIAQWVKNFDQKTSLKIHTPDEQELQRLGGRILQNEIDDFVKEHVLKETESKYKCQVGECSKAFKGFEFVEKHILTKHADEINRIKMETEYFNSYVCDPNHCLPTTPNNNNANFNMMSIPNMPFAQPMMMPMMPAFVGYQEPYRRPRPSNSSSSAMMDLENSLPRDPRQVTSYVDLDAPAEGDSNISFF